jgi:hypothetical protein
MTAVMTRLAAEAFHGRMSAVLVDRVPNRSRALSGDRFGDVTISSTDEDGDRTTSRV